LDSNGKEIPSQIIQYPSEFENVTTYRIFFVPTLPPVGYTTVYLKGVTDRSGDVSQCVILNSLTDPIVTLSNDNVSLTFEYVNGSYVSQNVTYSCPKEDKTCEIQTHRVSQGYYYYESDLDGVYILRTTAVAIPMKQNPTKSCVARGGIVQEFRQFFSENCSQIFRIYSSSSSSPSASVQINLPIELITYIRASVGQEIISRFDTSIESGNTLTTDSNGMWRVNRVLSQRWEDSSLPPPGASPGTLQAGMFYPAVYSTSLHDSTSSFYVILDRSFGVTSSYSGSIEAMIQRNTPTDDYRGVGPVTDTTPLVIRWLFGFEPAHSDISLSKVTTFQDVPHLRFVHNNPIFRCNVVLPNSSSDPAQNNQIFRTHYSFLKSPLPSPIHLFSLTPVSEQLSPILFRLHHIYEESQSLNPGNVTVDINNIFNAELVYPISKSTLTGIFTIAKLRIDGSRRLLETISPMDIATFSLGGLGSNRGENQKANIIYVLCVTAAFFLLAVVVVVWKWKTMKDENEKIFGSEETEGLVENS
jgi:hypothetical protein